MIDVHTHVFPTADEGRSWQEVVGFDPVRPGTVEDIGPRLSAAGIERAVVLLFPRSAHRYRALREAAGGEPSDADIRARVGKEISELNRWGCDLAARDGRFVAFVGVDPHFMSAVRIVDEIRAGAAAGARGVKIIPGAMDLYPDDPGLFPAYETCIELDLPLLSQSGASRHAPGPRGHYGHPAGFAPVLSAFPGLRLVLAHLGRGFDDDLVELVRRFPGAHADTSLRLGAPAEEDDWDPAPVRDLIGRLGTERVLFGTNYPIVDPVVYRRRFDALGLTDRASALIGRENAERLLGPG